MDGFEGVGSLITIVTTVASIIRCVITENTDVLSIMLNNPHVQ